MSLGTKILVILAGVALLLALVGGEIISPVFSRSIIFLALIYLAVSSFKTDEKIWTIFFVILVVLVNPFFTVINLPSGYWKGLYVLVAVSVATFLYRFYDGYRKGLVFENFVCSHLDPKDWVIEDRTKNWGKKLKRKVESDEYPDITVRNVSSDERLSIECKFRTRLWEKGGVTGVYWEGDSAKNYKKYGEKENLIVFIAFGIGGNPKSPEKLYLVPLDKISEFEDKIIPAQFLWPFEKKNLKDGIAPSDFKK